MRDLTPIPVDGGPLTRVDVDADGKPPRQLRLRSGIYVFTGGAYVWWPDMQPVPIPPEDRG